MTEHEIESRVERETNRLDRKLLKGQLTQEQYDQEIEKLSRWADAQYSRR